MSAMWESESVDALKVLTACVMRTTYVCCRYTIIYLTTTFVFVLVFHTLSLSPSCCNCAWVSCVFVVAMVNVKQQLPWFGYAFIFVGNRFPSLSAVNAYNAAQSVIWYCLRAPLFESKSTKWCTHWRKWLEPPPCELRSFDEALKGSNRWWLSDLLNQNELNGSPLSFECYRACASFRVSDHVANALHSLIEPEWMEAKSSLAHSTVTTCTSKVNSNVNFMTAQFY